MKPTHDHREPRIGRAAAMGCVLAVATLTTSPDMSSSAVIHVDGDATDPIEDGSSWCKAYRSLSDALNAAAPGDEVRVANGTHRPDPAGLVDPRAATFTLLDDVVLVGGYAGCGATEPDQRDIRLFESVLSGDLGAAGDPSDNAYNVLTASGADGARVDGCTVAEGNADACPDVCAPHDRGGGASITFGDLTFERCTFRHNVANRGGAIHVDSGTLTLHACAFVENESLREGGAIFEFNIDMIAESCLFHDNTAASDGGAIFSDLGLVTLTNVTVVANTSSSRGGGIYNYVGVEMRITNAIFWDNEDLSGVTEDAQLFNNPSNPLTVNYSCVEGWSGIHGGTGNMGADPEFLDPTGGDLHLVGSSPCVNAGDNSAVTLAFDLDGEARIVDDVVDLGAYEYRAVLGVGSPGPPPPVAITVRPHPIRHRTTIGLAVPSTHVDVFDVTGRKVMSIDTARRSEVIWDRRDHRGRDVAPGVYVLRAHDGTTTSGLRTIVVTQ